MSNVYIPQHSFVTGEVSPDIENRTDLDKYRSALLMARNCVIRPYGSVAKRNGSRYIGNVKYNNKRVRLIEFKGSPEAILEVGDGYIRVWQNDNYTGVEISTPFGTDILDSLHFNQSADTMLICSGVYPVYMLQRSGTNWNFYLYDFTVPPFEAVNTDSNHKLSCNNGDRLYSSVAYFTPSMVGAVFKLKHRMPSSVWNGSNGNYYESPRITYGTNRSSHTGYTGMDIGSYSDDMELEWKIVTHGTWTGNVEMKIRNFTDSDDFVPYRNYSSNNDYNLTESGTIPRGSQLSINSSISSGNVKIDFMIKPYEQAGLMRVKQYISPTELLVEIIKPCGKTSQTSEWYISSWGNQYGYPTVSTFFQDRFVLAGSRAFPYRVWMSRTGDYPNFDVERVDGTITDDSAVDISLISRSAFTIAHIVAAQDLILLTDGNEWIVDGSETVKPTRAVPRSQTQHGASNCDVQYIGNRLVYVQRRSSSVRDLGYTYESDNYNGADLTLLAKHLINGHSLLSSAYCQEPDSILYYVRDDGVILALTLIKEQDVFGWAHYVTDGKYEDICSIPNGNEDSLYVVVNRTINGETRRYIERLDSPKDSDNIQDYTLMDSMIEITGATTTTVAVPHLAGKTVNAIIDDTVVEGLQVGSDGNLTLPIAAVSNLRIGVSYEMRIVLPQVAMDNLKDGTLQGRTVKTNAVILRLRNSRGGHIGISFNRGMDAIGDASLIEMMYTGDVKVNVPAQGKGFDNNASVCILHDEPYPFNLLSVVRDVTIGGGAIARYNNNPL